MNKVNNRIALLLKKQTFWTGFSSVLSVFGNPNIVNISKNSQKEDLNALKSDWEIVGQDFKNSMRNLPY
jgi:hypothetical protein